MEDWHRIQNLFPIRSNYIWLNSSGTNPLNLHIKNYLDKYLKQYSEHGIFSPDFTYPVIQTAILRHLSRLVNCNSQDLVLVHNTAEAMNFISHGIDLKSGDEILLLENEYPSNIYPWQHWQTKGVEIKTIAMAAHPSAFLENFFAIVSKKTKLVSLSAVHWCTGMPLPLKEISLYCRENDIFLAVDGAQAVGHLPLDLSELSLNALAFPAWKWLLGPLGLAVLYISRDSINRIEPVFRGANSVVRDQEYLPYKSELKPDAARFQFSTPSFNDWVYFKASLDLLAEIGFEQVQNRILRLARRLQNGLLDLGFTLSNEEFSEFDSAICAAAFPRLESREILDRLQKKNLIATERLERIRFSPHIHLMENDIDEALNLIESALN